MLVNVNADHGRKHVSMWHIVHEMILAARVRLIDQEYGNVMKASRVCIHVAYSMKWFLRQGFACWSGIWKSLWKRWKCVSTRHIPWNDSCGEGSLVDQEYGNVYESAESVYSRRIFLEMILAPRVRLLIRNMEMFMKALKVCIHVAYSLKWFLRQGLACWSGIWKCL